MNSIKVLIPTGKATRWTKEEINILVPLATESMALMKEKCSPTLTSNIKNKCLESIVESINATNIDKGSLPQIKQKWLDLRRDSTQTGGRQAHSEIRSNDLK